MTQSEKEGGRRKRHSIFSLGQHVASFLYHLLRDPRVPWRVKAVLVGLAAYLASPIDIIPDWIPVVGYLDDVLMVGLAAGYVLARVPPEVVREHWGEDVEVLQSLRRKPRRKGTRN